MKAFVAGLLVASLLGCTSPPVSQNTVEPPPVPPDVEASVKAVEKAPPSAQELIAGSWRHSQSDGQKLTKVMQFFPDGDYTQTTIMNFGTSSMRFEYVGTWAIFGTGDLKLNYEVCTYRAEQLTKCEKKITTDAIMFPDSNTLIYPHENPEYNVMYNRIQ